MPLIETSASASSPATDDGASGDGSLAPGGSHLMSQREELLGLLIPRMTALADQLQAR